jgi:phytanoyl-CoA hydroxylase
MPWRKTIVKLTPEQIQQFRTEGYLALPQFWSPDEVAALQAELKRLQRDGKLRNVATDDDGKTHSQTKANLQLCPMSPHSSLFRALPFAPRVIETVRQLIGDPVVLHLDQVFLKPAGHGAGTNWHQDNAYFRIPDPLKGTAMWTAVHDATVANGTIRVIPRSYESLMEHSRDPQSDHHIRCYPDESKAIDVELPAGGVCFFAYGVAHATGPNNTERERAGAAYHFLNGDSVPETYFGSQDGSMKHPILTGPHASDGTAEYGFSLASRWPEEVRQAL